MIIILKKKTKIEEKEEKEVKKMCNVELLPI